MPNKNRNKTQSPPTGEGKTESGAGSAKNWTAFRGLAGTAEPPELNVADSAPEPAQSVRQSQPGQKPDEKANRRTFQFPGFAASCDLVECIFGRISRALFFQCTLLPSSASESYRPQALIFCSRLHEECRQGRDLRFQQRNDRQTRCPTAS